MLSKAILESGKLFSVKFTQNNDVYLLKCTDDEICELHEFCSDYLPIVGFDNNYNLNEQGRVLESLIDKFHDSLEQ